MESKAAVENFHVSQETVASIVKQFGFELISQQLITGGFSGVNLKCELQPPGCQEERRELLLKVNNPDHSVEDIEFQASLLTQLQQLKFRTNYLHPLQHAQVEAGFPLNTAPCWFVHVSTDQDGAVQHSSLLLDFVRGTPGDKLLAQHAADPAAVKAIMMSLGTTLAELHLCAPQIPEPGRDFRCGFPVSNTGDLLNVGFMEHKLESDAVAGNEFVGFILSRLQKFRDLYRDLESLPTGVIHGDAYLDNTLYNSDTLRLEALVDWEDACEGPLVLDLAVAAMAACFTEENELVPDRLAYIFEGYCQLRGGLLSQAEVDAIPR